MNVRLFYSILLLSLLTCGTARAQEGKKASVPELRVEFFGAERGVAIGAESVTLLCVLRNVGNAPLPEKTVRLRCYAVAGLDYTPSETMPVLPAMAANQALAFRWRLTPNTEKTPLVAAVLLEPYGELKREGTAIASKGPVSLSGSPMAGGQSVPDPLASSAVITVVPRLAAPLRGGSRAVLPGGAPQSSATAEDAWLSNDVLAVRVVEAERRTPVFLISGRDGAEWRPLATGVSLAAVLSGEEGQIPWWETFRWREARANADKTTASVTLLGTVGTRWKAELTLEAQKDSAALNGQLRLTAQRTLRCYSLELPRLLVAPDDKNALPPKADGLPQPVVEEESPLAENAPLAAARRSGIAFGLTWPSAPPFTGWNWRRLPAGDSASALLLGAQTDRSERGEVIQAGATVTLTFRLFAVSPSNTIRDAQRFVLP